MRAIFTADDFGVSIGTNKAIERAFRQGVLTSASIRTNGVAFLDAVKRAKKNPKLAIGLHLNVTDGKPHTRAIPQRHGYYKYDFLEYFIRLNLGGKELLGKIENDFRYQFSLVRKHGLKIDHFDGQDHVHMIPQIFDLVCRLACEYKINALRVSREPIGLDLDGGIIKALILNILSLKDIQILRQYGLVTTDHYFGVVHTNNMNEDNVLRILSKFRKEGKDLEIALHPAFPNDKEDMVYTSPFFAMYSNLPNRKLEFDTLISKRVIKFVKKNKISLINFSDLVK